jgi:hypothetical protein
MQANNPNTHCKRKLRVRQRRLNENEVDKSPPPTGFEPRTVQPVESRCTDPPYTACWVLPGLEFHSDPNRSQLT